MDSASAFVGSIPALYDRHLGPVLFDPYARDLARRLPADTAHVLEVAAGTGRLTRALLAALPPHARVLATDLNDPMIARGIELTPDPRVTWRQADAQALPVEDRRFDVVACQFGLMFVPDKSCALAEMRRALRPGGTLLLNTWSTLADNPLSERVRALAKAALADDLPPHMQVAFSLSDPVGLRELIVTAAFGDVRVETVGLPAVARSAADLAAGFVRGSPLCNMLAECGVEPDVFEAALAADLARRFGDAPCQAPLSAHVVTAIA